MLLNSYSILPKEAVERMDIKLEFDKFIREYGELFTEEEVAMLKSDDPVIVGQTFFRVSKRMPRNKPLFSNFMLPNDSDYRGTLMDIRFVQMLLPSQKTKEVFLYASHIGSIVFSATHYTRRDNYPYYLLVSTFSGVGCLEYQGQCYTLRPGDGFFIDGMRPHCYYATSAEGWGYDIIEFNGAGAYSYYAMVEKDNTHKFAFSEESAFFKVLCDLKLNCEKVSEDFLDFYVNMQLTCLLTEVLYQQQVEKQQSTPDWMKTALNYIKENHHNAVTLDSLSTQIAISKYHLAREIKRFTGKTFSDYLGDIRMKQAKQYLLVTQLPVAIIAEMVGYQSIPYFITRFKDREGITPYQFRKSNRR